MTELALILIFLVVGGYRVYASRKIPLRSVAWGFIVVACLSPPLARLLPALRTELLAAGAICIITGAAVYFVNWWRTDAHNL